METLIYNSHTHVFNKNHIPHKFVPIRLVRLLMKGRGTQGIARFLHMLNPFSNKDVFDRYSKFIRQGDFETQEVIFNNMRRAYPGNTKFVILSMDFEFMEAGVPKYSFIEQLNELAQLKEKYPDHVFNFICVDPRRNKVDQLVRTYIEEKGFSGIKLYPPLGFYPFDERLDKVYDYAQKHQIPIMMHCSRGGIFYRGKLKKADCIHPKTGKALKKRKNKKFMDHYTDPANYAYVLEKFPDLKICFAHFGGGDEWEKYRNSPDPEVYKTSWLFTILELIKNHPNVYADTSYTFADFSLLPQLKVLLATPKVRDRILFGSDFYMSNLEGSEYKWSVDLRGELGEHMYRLIAETNPKNYLGLNKHQPQAWVAEKAGELLGHFR